MVLKTSVNLILKCKVLATRAFHLNATRHRQKDLVNEQIMKVLNVAEKNDAAKHIAGFLSNGTSRMRQGLSVYNKLYEFDYNILGRNCKMIMTSVSGHILNHEFVGNYRSWQKVPPISLFDAPIIRECNKNMDNIKKTLEREASTSDVLVIWTDCDREGENIGFEIIEICKKAKPNLQIYRAKFSEITAPSVRRAAANLVPPDENINNAVEVRRELDLRIGAAFTRLQTLRLKRVFPEQLADTLISYGSCQFPTLGFVVERYKAIENFIAEQFWKIRVEHKIKDITVDFHWNRVRLFDELFCQVLFDRCQEKPTAKVTNVREKSKSKWRPQPLDTVELEKLASRKLKINAKETMRIAEKLYTQGYISYPRTETNIFPKELNLVDLVQHQTRHRDWGNFAARVLQEGPNPRQGKKSDQAHPPIHPLKFADNLQGNEQRIYEFIVRHFLACLSKDALGMETVVHININEEIFVASGLTILELNYLEVYPYDKWSDKEIHRYVLGQEFTPTKLEMTNGETSPPNLLTEADLISLMELHGIGTDATHADHIETIKSRLYVGLEDGIHFLPCHLGMGLVEGYDDMGFFLSKPDLRAELEADLKRICDGEKDPQEVLRIQIGKYRDVFRIAMQQAEKIDLALAKYYNTQPQNVGPEIQQAFELEAPVMKCPSCSLDINIKKRNNGGFYLGCMGFPACRSSIWFPASVIDVTISPNSCPQCGPTVKQLNFKFTPGSMTPFYPNEYTGCVNGCDAQLMDVLNIRPLRPNQGGAGGQASQTLRPNNRDPPAFQQTNNRFQPPPPAPPAPPVQQNRQNFRNQNQNDDNPDNVTCHCGIPAKSFIVRKETVNKGRPFFSCSKSMDEKCTFFQWGDEDAAPQQQQNGFRNNRAPNNFQNNFPDRRQNNFNNRQGGNEFRGGGGGERARRKCSKCRQEGHTLRNCPN